MRSSSIKNQPQSSIGMLRLALVLVGIIAGCYISINAAIAENFKTANPSRAASVWPKNGFALSAVADEKLNEAAAAAADAGKSDFILGNSVKLQGIGNIALQSFKAEPLNASALRSLAFAAEAKGDLLRAKKLMADAIKFSRRDTAANNWQLQHALKAQNLPVSMQLVDRILREDDSLYLSYLPALIAGVSQPEGMNAILPLLLRQPEWEAQFWSMAANQPKIPPELAVLRQNLYVKRRQKVPIVPFLEADVYLIQNLIRSNQFDAAKSLHDFLTGQDNAAAASKADGKLRGGFTQFGSPFDWQLESNVEVQAYIDDARDGLNLEVGPNSIGIFARNIIKSTTGQFSVKVSAKVEKGVELFARLRCLEINKKIPIINLALNDNYSSTEKTNPVDCDWFSLEILAQNKLQEPTTLNITAVEISSN
jgi:hypothetical protein